MNSNKINNNLDGFGFQDDVISVENVSRTFLSKVFTWMFAALAISAGFAYIFSHDQNLLQLIVNEEGRYTAIGQVCRWAPLGFVLLMSFGYNKLSPNALKGLFVVYAAIMGISLSVIFLMFDQNSIMAMFAASSAMFGIMALAGAKTSTDLTKMGSILMMGLIGIVIASIINYFIASEQISYIISIIGVIIFTGLTAYDTQKLKNIGMGVDMEDESTGKLVIMGALTLYLDFINLFLMMLRLFGGRRR